jgi:hypothetical protein
MKLLIFFDRRLRLESGKNVASPSWMSIFITEMVHLAMELSTFSPPSGIRMASDGGYAVLFMDCDRVKSPEEMTCQFTQVNLEKKSASQVEAAKSSFKKAVSGFTDLEFQIHKSAFCSNFSAEITPAMKSPKKSYLTEKSNEHKKACACQSRDCFVQEASPLLFNKSCEVNGNSFSIPFKRTSPERWESISAEYDCKKSPVTLENEHNMPFSWTFKGPQDSKCFGMSSPRANKNVAVFSWKNRGSSFVSNCDVVNVGSFLF